ncbi:MAG TPA: DUF2617 family protein [bacterium]|nr:DUF2617 family protein [bacterium]
MQSREFHNLAYIDQSIHELTNYLLAESLEACGLQTLASRRIERDNYTAEIRIIGASHAIHFASAAGQWSEILACLSAPPANSEVLLQEKVLPSAIFEEKILSKRTPGGLHYRFQARGTALSQELYEASIANAPAASSMGVTFPGETQIPPFTGLTWTATEAGLSVDSVHAYPQDGAGVLSRSLFALNEQSVVHFKQQPFGFRFTSGDLLDTRREMHV